MNYALRNVYTAADLEEKRSVHESKINDLTIKDTLSYFGSFIFIIRIKKFCATGTNRS